jgi:thymidylate synthase
VWPNAIFAELLWMLSGSTNNEDLQELGSNIWTPWVDHEFELRNGYISGSFGPVYGFQLRHFGGHYAHGRRPKKQTWWNIVMDWACLNQPLWEYGEGGFDQLTYMMKELKENPNSRRILWSLWNPKQMHKMRLPPCHFTFQLFVHEDKLSGHLTQRSCDFPVGGPANIQFYSALVYMFAQQAGYKPHELVHTSGDSHIYVNQIEAVEEYLGRPAPPSPRLKLEKADDISSYKMEDFNIIDYSPEPKLPIPVPV